VRYDKVLNSPLAEIDLKASRLQSVSGFYFSKLDCLSLTRALISEARHTDTLGDSLMGAGYIPFLMPA
jgi:hypothetical protein